MIALCRRFASLTPGDRRLVFEAAALLMFVWIGLRILRFRTLRRTLEYYADPANNLPGRARPAPNVVGRVSWAVTAAARQLHVSMTCLVKALAADALLRSRGLASELRVGVRERGSGAKPLEAHAWVEYDGQVVMGEIECLSDYSVLSPAGCS